MKTAARAGVSLRPLLLSARSRPPPSARTSIFARSTFKTAARAGVSFRAATAVAPVRTFKTTAVRRDEASKEDSIHVVHYEKSQRRELDIEVDEAKPVNPAVQDAKIIVARKVDLELVTDKAALVISRLLGNGLEEVCWQLAAEQQKDGFLWTRGGMQAACSRTGKGRVSMG